MPHAVVGIVLVAHGLITTMIGFGSMANPPSATMPTPSWLAWWPGTLGRSWVLDGLNVGSGPAALGGLVWLAAGLALIGAGVGWLGVSVASDQWQSLALIGAALGLVALALGIQVRPNGSRGDFDARGAAESRLPAACCTAPRVARTR
jgi:hypothetical protein